MKLQGKVAIVTGAGQGIGEAIAIAFAKEGTNVLVADLNYANAQRVAGQLQTEYNVKAEAVYVDVSDNASVVAMVAAAQEKLGPVDILVNNAGIAQAKTPFEDITKHDWERLLGVNLQGTINCCQAVIPSFKARKYGKIINMSSLSGEAGGLAVAPTYAVSKAAIINLTKCLAKYLGPDQINVNAVAPGFIKTKMTEKFNYDPETVPLKRIGEPEEVADLVLFLASDRSKYITGATMDVNGGYYMK